MSFSEIIFEPYFIGFILALVFTLIVYFLRRNDSLPEIDESNPKNKKKRSASMSHELKSILIFICSFCLFTSLIYIIKNSSFSNVLSSGTLLSSIPLMSGSSESVLLTTENVEELIKENIDEIIPLKEEKKKRVVDESLIAGKRKSPHKTKDNLQFMNTKEAKYIDDDIDTKAPGF